jgi:hypothetical protein
VKCGAGNDRVVADKLDKLRGCEHREVENARRRRR